MSTLGNSGSNPPAARPVPVLTPPSGPPGPPKVDMMASAEMQAYLDRLQAEDRKIGTRNKYLTVALAAGVLLLLLAVWGVYRATIGTYAVIEDVQIQQHPIDQGRLRIKFRVVSAGRVFCRRTSGPFKAELIDYFDQPCEVDRAWPWVYQPGKDIDVTLWYRGGLSRQTHQQSFSTLGRADIVILMDTTESMDPSIDELKEQCVVFSEQLRKKALKHRFALIGFGDTNSPPWVDSHPFTPDAMDFFDSVDNVKRFEGVDFPESALDALEEALLMPLDKHAIRRFYLVTDNQYHEPTRSGATAEDVATRLTEQKVLLRVFSKRKYETDYAKLLGETGRFQEIENFGKVLSEGRILED